MTSNTDTNGVATGVNNGASGSAFNPNAVNLSDTSNPNLMRDVICALNASSNEYNGQLGQQHQSKLGSHLLTGTGARVSAIFVILVVSSAATFFPVLAARVRWMRIPIHVYLFARYFGAGVIVATAFVQ